MSFSTWSELASYVADGNKANIAHLCLAELGDGDFRFWNGRYPLTAFGHTWEPLHGQVAFSDISTDDENFVQGSEITITPQGYEFAKLVMGDYETNALYRPVTRYMAVFDDNFEEPLFDTLVVVQSGILDQISYDETPDGVAIKIAVEGALTTRRIANLGYYTDFNLKLRYPTARGFEFMSIIADTEVTWPKYD